MPAVWPFPVRTPLLESAEWLTDVIQTKNLEQRFAMRQTPREGFSFSHVLTDAEYQAGRALIRANETFYVPDWPLRLYVGPVEPNSAGFIDYGLPYATVSPGDVGIVWESADLWELVNIESIDSITDGFYLDSISQAYNRAYFIPLRTAQTQTGLEASRTAHPLVECSIDFDLTDSVDVGASAYPTYQGDDLIDDCPAIASGSFDEQTRYPIRAVDPGIHYPEFFRARSPADVSSAMRWHVFTAAELWTLRRFVHSRRGRWKSFWLSSWRRDFELFTSIGAAATSIQVYARGLITDLGVSSFDIEIAGQYRRRVTSWSIAGGVATLNLDASTGVALGTSAKVSRLYHMRFAADRIEFTHAAEGGVSVTIPCVEVSQ